MDTSPVGDIKIKKSPGTYNTYKLELSWGQIEAIRQALTKDRDNALSDELLAMLDFYQEELPGPGETDDDIKQRQDVTKSASDAGSEDDYGLEAPPDEDVDADITDGNLPPLPSADDNEPLSDEAEDSGSESDDNDSAAGEPDDSGSDVEADVDDLLPEPDATQ